MNKYHFRTLCALFSGFRPFHDNHPPNRDHIVPIRSHAQHKSRVSEHLP